MKKYFIILSCLYIFNLPALFSLPPAVTDKFPSRSEIICAPQLQKLFQALLKIPEAKALINAIRNEGPIQIRVEDTPLSKKFGAFWDPDRRVIYIDLSSCRNEGYVTGSLLFELHNASVNSKINHLNQMAAQRQISKEKYVESMEYLEYINALSASKIANIGIKMGILPAESALPVYPNFKEHFKAQKMSGHSDCFARNYEMCL